MGTAWLAVVVLADVALFAWWTRRRRARRRDARATLAAVRDWFRWRDYGPGTRELAESLARAHSMPLEDAARAWRVGGSA